MRDQSDAEDGYEPSADEDDDGYEIFPRSKKRKRVKLKFKKKGCDLQDPLVVCGCDIMSMILSRLDARSVASSLLVSCRWYSVASTDTICSKKCEELWASKAHLPRFPQVEGLSKLSAYSLSIEDGKWSRIMKEYLWDHAWEFHFQKEAPAYWRNLDPYWKGTDPPMHSSVPDADKKGGTGPYLPAL